MDLVIPTFYTRQKGMDQQLGELVDLFLVFGYDIGLECYKAGTKDMHSLFTSPDFFSE